MVSVVKLAYEDTVEAWLGAIARSWAESPCTCAKFNEIPETDKPTDGNRKTHITRRDAMHALRRSAIIVRQRFTLFAFAVARSSKISVPWVASYKVSVYTVQAT